MTRGKKATTPKVEVEKPLTDVHTEAEIEVALEPEGWEPPESLSAEQVLRLAAGESGADVAPMDEHEPEGAFDTELAQHVRDLVGLFFQHEIQALEQRITDLELLVGQPQDSVQFVTPPVSPPLWSNDQKQNPGNAGDAPWYQPTY